MLNKREILCYISSVYGPLRLLCYVESVFEAAKLTKNCRSNKRMKSCKQQWIKRADGCSVPIVSSRVTEALFGVFHNACNLHDLCYSSLGVNKEKCDKWFHTNMIQSCSLPTKLGTPQGAPLLCKVAADIFYKAVKDHGGPSYENGQDWAKSNCN